MKLLKRTSGEAYLTTNSSATVDSIMNEWRKHTSGSHALWLNVSSSLCSLVKRVKSYDDCNYKITISLNCNCHFKVTRAFGRNEPPSFKCRLIIYKNHNKGTSCIENNQGFYKQWFENHKILIKTNKHARLKITNAHWTKRALHQL